MIPQAITTGLSVGTSIYSAYQNAKAQERAYAEMQRKEAELRAKENYYTNKFMNEYNNQFMRKRLIEGGDFTKTGSFYQSLKNQLGRENTISSQNATDALNKRGLGNSGIVGQTQAGISNNLGNSMATAMGNYAGGLGSNMGMLQGQAMSNRSNELAYNREGNMYASSQPDLGNIFSSVGSFAEMLAAEQNKKNRMINTGTIIGDPYRANEKPLVGSLQNAYTGGNP